MPRSDTTHHAGPSGSPLSPDDRFGVRTHVEHRAQLAGRPLDQAGREQVADRQHGIGRALRDGELQREEPQQQVERVATGRRPPGRHRLVALQRGTGERPEPVGDPVDGVTRRQECLPDPAQPAAGAPN